MIKSGLIYELLEQKILDAHEWYELHTVDKNDSKGKDIVISVNGHLPLDQKANCPLRANYP